MKTADMLNYVREDLGAEHLPDFSKAHLKERSLDEIPISEFPKRVVTRRRPDPSDRKEVVPKGCPINVTDNRISEIYKELRTLKLGEARNAIAVLLRVFLELSVDHWLERNGISLKFTPPGGREKYKTLDKKLAEVVDHLVSLGVSRDHFASVIFEASASKLVQCTSNYSTCMCTIGSRLRRQNN